MTAEVDRIGIAQTGEGTLVLRLAGPWVLGEKIPAPETVERALAQRPDARRLAFDTSALGEWDTTVITFLKRVSKAAEAKGLQQDRTGLPHGVQKLLGLAEAVPDKEDARRGGVEGGFLHRVGLATLEVSTGIGETLSFIGESTVTLGRAFTGKMAYRKADLALLLQQSGVDALPIVTLVNFLLGLILAFVGAVQLQQFGAEIYVANLVGIAMVRDMSALMTGIIMAGRSGAAFAAEIGSMNSNQELDALQTTGISPMEFLVLPRVWALVVMMPLLVLYANLVGILGGLVVGLGMLDLSWTAYWQQTVGAVSMTHLVSGLIKGLVYGLLVAVAGCMRGMQAGRSALAVGGAATSAVVTGIVWIIAACGIFQFLSFLLGI
jgi:phospholipid/cholesterol/gamma-HCH transport system permease protein